MSEVVTVTITSEGRRLEANLPVLHVDIWQEVNRIPTAQVMVADGSIVGRAFSVSQDGAFDPGKVIEIHVRREGIPKSQRRVFKGIVVSQSVEASGGQSRMVAELKDTVVALSTVRRNRVFRDQKDSEIWTVIFKEYKIQVEDIAETGYTHPELVQFDCSDWDFILLRAEANGLLVAVRDGRVTIGKPPKLDKNTPNRFEFGMSNILGLEMKADAGRPIGQLSTTAWEVSEQENVEPVDGTPYVPKQGNLDTQNLSAQMGTEHVALSSTGWRQNDALSAWADGRLLRNRMAFYRGWIAIVGQGDLALLDTIRILGISNVFNGLTFITGLRHQIHTGSWRTDMQFGLAEEPYAQTYPDTQGLPAGGLTAGISGLHIGVVDTFEEDPEGQHRVRVRLPGLGGDVNQQVVWARHARPDAGLERGLFAYPEPDDEVVLGFLHGDPSEPIILGSLHSSVNALPLQIDQPAENNFVKGIQTREGIQIRFDDETKTLTVVTANGQEVVLNGQDKTIHLKDGNNNEFILNDSGIQLKSGGDILIEAGGKVEIKGSAVDVK